jgi:hypothetical protein
VLRDSWARRAEDADCAFEALAAIAGSLRDERVRLAAIEALEDLPAVTCARARRAGRRSESEDPGP